MAAKRKHSGSLTSLTNQLNRVKKKISDINKKVTEKKRIAKKHSDLKRAKAKLAALKKRKK